MKCSNMRFLDVPARIGLRLRDRAMRQGDVCNWEIWRSDGPDASLAPAGANLYQGSSGIALFLAELHRCTGEADFAELAEAGMGHALSEIPELPGRQLGAYTRQLGIAVAAQRLGVLLGWDDFVAAAGEILKKLAGREHEDEGLDVLAGAAGTIPELLRMHFESRAELPPEVDPLDIATRLGEHLVAVAYREPGGWS
ncbi:MAG: hypothetical protein MI919_09710 [Holophagales bacterium]|nr:hypothetical protein [Holophagales bacterium]